MIKKILNGELKALLGREATTEEFNSAIAYINDHYDDITDMSDVTDALYNWRDEQCTQCEACGCYHLDTDMEEFPISWDYIDKKLCNQACFLAYCESHCPEKPEISQHI